MKQGRKSQKVAIFVASSAVVLASVLTILTTSSASANYLCVSARCKQAEAAQAEAQRQQNAAASEKNSYQAEVDRLSAEISGIQAEIQRSEEEIKQLDVEIINTEKKIERLRESIKKAVVQIYHSSTVSEFEILASAESVADFTTRTANQEIIQNKVKQLADESKAAKVMLQEQQDLAKQKKAENEAMNSVLMSRQAEQQEFVNQWAGKEAEFAESAKEAADVIAAESWAQYLENQREQQQNSGGSSGSSWPVYDGENTYPWQGKCPGNYSSAGWNTWGNGYYCQCTSYAGWKAYEYYGGHIWGSTNTAWGDAKYWINSAAARGFSTGSEPRANSIGVATSGSTGHVFWVDWVSGNLVHISEYNYGYYTDFGSREFTVDYSKSKFYQYIYL